MKIIEHFIDWFNRHSIISWTITIMMAFLIFFISTLTFTEPPGGISVMSYIYHFTAFSYLTLFLLISLTKGRIKGRSSLVVIGVVLALLYGISDEIHQYFIPYRAFSVGDILVDSMGILITSIAYYNSLQSKSLA